MSVVTLSNVAEIHGCAKQPICTELRIVQELTVHPEKITKRCASHLRFRRTQVRELGRGSSGRRYAMQRHLSKMFAAVLGTLPCADAVLLTGRFGFGVQHSLLVTSAGKRLLKTGLAIRLLSPQRYPVLGPAPIRSPSMISCGVYLSTLQRCCGQHRLVLLRKNERMGGQTSRSWNDVVRTSGEYLHSGRSFARR